MSVWTIAMFAVLGWGAFWKVIALAGLEYPRRVTRGSDALDVVLTVALLVWGIVEVTS